MANPLRLKKLISGPTTVPVIQAIVRVPRPGGPSRAAIKRSASACAAARAAGCGSGTNIKATLQMITIDPRTRNVACQ